MAKKDRNPMKGALVAEPPASGASREGSPLLAFLIVLLILVGIADMILWGVVGYYFLQNDRNSSGGAPVQTTPAAVTPSGAEETGSPADGDEVKREALIAYIEELNEIAPLEDAMRESLASVIGTNYTDDAVMYAEITERTLPLCQQMNERILEIVPGDAEIGALCEMHRNYATKCLNALNAILSALDNQDDAQFDEANSLLNETFSMGPDFRLTLQRLAEERNVPLNLNG